MLAVNYSTIRNNLKSYCDEATDNGETVIVTRKAEKNIVILSLEKYNQLVKAAQNAEYIGYATPNVKAQKLLPKEIRNDKQFYPSEQAMKNLEVYRDLGPKKIQEYNDLFLEFKMYGR